MKAAVLRAPRVIQIEDVPMPEPGPGEVLIRVAACSICGSDVHTWQGDHPKMHPPTISGHEFSGVVAAVGESVTGIEVGLKAAVDGVIPCHQCIYCRRGLGNVCLDYRITGFRFDGALAEYTKVPAGNVHPMPPNLSFEEAALAQPLSIAYRGVYQKAKVAAGETVAVQGAGPIGLCAMTLARSCGARVIALDYQADRLEVAAAVGADEVVHLGQDDPVARALAFSDGVGVDKVIEAVGGTQDETLRLGCLMARRGATITVLGSFSQNRVTVPALDFKWKEIDILASQSYYGVYPDCLKLLASGKVPLGKMISHVLPLAETQQAFELIDTHAPGVVKIVVKPYSISQKD